MDPMDRSCFVSVGCGQMRGVPIWMGCVSAMNPFATPDSFPGHSARLRRRQFMAVALLAALVALELGARFFFPIPPRGSLRPDATYGYLPEPFAPRKAGPKPPGKRRVLILGDSFAAGAGSSAVERRWSETLLRSLQARSAAWEAVNAGVIGWGPAEEKRFLEKEGAALGPDIALIQVFLANDATDETGLTRISVFHGAPVLASEIGTAPKRLWAWMRLRCRLLYAISGALKNIPLVLARQKANPPYPDVEWRSLMRRRPWLEGEFYALTRGTDPFYEGGLDRLLEDLEQMGETCRHMGAMPLFLLIPGRLQTDAALREYAFQLNGIPEAEADVTKFNRRIGERLRSRGYNFLDLLPPMQGRPAGSPLLYHTGHDDHFNDEGHRFAGETVADWLLRLEEEPGFFSERN